VGEAACVTELALTLDPVATQARFRLEAGEDGWRRDDRDRFAFHAARTIMLKSAGVTEVAPSLLPVSAYGHHGRLSQTDVLHGTRLNELQLRLDLGQRHDWVKVMRESAQLTIVTFALKKVPANRFGVTSGDRLDHVNHWLEEPADLGWPERDGHLLLFSVPEAAGSSVGAASLQEMPTHVGHGVVPAVLHRSELKLMRRIDHFEALYVRACTVLEVAVVSQRAAAHLPVPADFLRR
jgi:hypothetical protein